MGALAKEIQELRFHHNSHNVRNRTAIAGSVGFTAIIVGLICFHLVGCTWQKTEPIQIEDLPVGHQVMGIPVSILKEADLRVAWQVRLPMGRAKEIVQVFYHNQQLYVVNDHNVLTAIDGKTGIINWSTTLVPDTNPSCSEPSYYKDRMLFALNNTVVEIREKDGKKTFPKEQLELSFPVATSVARSAKHLFVGSTDRNFYCLHIAGGAIKWKSIRTSEPTGAVVVHNDKVYFARRNGVLYVSRTDSRKLIWSMETVDSMPGAVIRDRQCFVPSLDTTLYCLNPVNGREIWKYLAGGGLEELPVITETSVYQPVRYGSLLCLDRQSPDRQGHLRWELPDGRAMLAENDNVVYAINAANELVVMDNTDGGGILVSFYLPQTDLYARNSEDATIFLAGKDGSLVALQPD